MPRTNSNVSLQEIAVRMLRVPGVIGFYIQEMLGCSDEQFDFHRWYLREKRFIELTEHGTIAITVLGIDHVISLSRTTAAEKLLIGQSFNA